MSDFFSRVGTNMVRTSIVEGTNVQPSLIQQLLEVLRNFGEAEEARCQYTAGLLLRMWQLAGPNRPAPAPSFLMVKAQGADSLLTPLLEMTHMTLPSDHKEISPVDIEAVQKHARLARSHTFKMSDHWWLKNVYYRAVGHLDSRLYIDDYVRRLDPHLGFITWGGRYHKTLTVRTAADLQAMRNDLKGTACDFAHPEGYTDLLQWNRLHCNVAGECLQKDWGEELVSRAVEGGFPLLFLPHGPFLGTPWGSNAAMSSPRYAKSSWQHALGMFIAFDLQRESPTPFTRDEMFDSTPAEAEFLGYLQTKVANLPSTYVSIVWEAMRSLKWIACPILQWMCHSSVTFLQLGFVLGEYLWRATAGIVLGVESLGYFCYGNYAMKERHLPMEILRYIREQGGCRKRDLSRRFQKIIKEQRDEVLVGLAERRLVVIDDVHVHPVSKEVYLSSLRSAPGFPDLVDVCEWPPIPPPKRTAAKKAVKNKG